MEKIHFKILDLAKFLACLAIVCRHCHPLGNDGNMADYVQMFTNAVPFFFVASSFLFWYKKGSLKKYVFRLSRLYIVWFLIMLPVVYYKFFSPPNLLNFVLSLFFHNTFYASWYIMASILGMAIVYGLSKKLNNIFLTIVGLLSFFLAMVFSTYHDLFVGTLLGEYVDLIGNYVYFSNSFSVAIIYIVLGKILAENFDRIKDSRFFIDYFMLTIFVILYVLEYKFSENYAQITKACCLMVIPVTYCLVRICVKSYKIQYPKSQWAKFLRVSSILIYLLHPILLRGVAFTTGCKQNVLQFIFAVLIGLFLSWIIYKWSDKYKILKYLY